MYILHYFLDMTRIGKECNLVPTDVNQGWVRKVLGSSDLCFDFSFRRSGDFKAVKVKAGGAMANHDVFLAPEITMANGYGAGIVKNQAFSLTTFFLKPHGKTK